MINVMDLPCVCERLKAGATTETQEIAEGATAGGRLVTPAVSAYPAKSLVLENGQYTAAPNEK